MRAVSSGCAVSAFPNPLIPVAESVVGRAGQWPCQGWAGSPFTAASPLLAQAAWDMVTHREGPSWIMAGQSHTLNVLLSSVGFNCSCRYYLAGAFVCGFQTKINNFLIHRPLTFSVLIPVVLILFQCFFSTKDKINFLTFFSVFETVTKR